MGLSFWPVREIIWIEAMFGEWWRTCVHMPALIPKRYFPTIYVIYLPIPFTVWKRILYALRIYWDIRVLKQQESIQRQVFRHVRKWLTVWRYFRLDIIQGKQQHNWYYVVRCLWTDKFSVFFIPSCNKKTISISYVNNYIMFYGLIVEFQKAILNIYLWMGKYIGE